MTTQSIVEAPQGVVTMEGRPVRVLLVDDDESVREVLGLYADVHATICGEAADGREAVALAERLRPDVIILDEDMPVMTGLEALALVRERVPDSIVVMYASGPPGTAQRALDGGAALYFDKAVRPRDVVSGALAAVATARAKAPH
jgi:CheY-like chemotaxis protein